MTGYLAYILPVDGGGHRPDNSLPGWQGGSCWILATANNPDWWLIPAIHPPVLGRIQLIPVAVAAISNPDQFRSTCFRSGNVCFRSAGCPENTPPGGVSAGQTGLLFTIRI